MLFSFIEMADTPACAGRWTPAGLHCPALGWLLDDDLVYVHLYVFFDHSTLMRLALTDARDHARVLAFRGRWSYALMMARLARNFLINRVILAHADCSSLWVEGELEALATRFVDNFARVLTGPRSALLSAENTKKALEWSAELGPDADFTNGWGWKELLRFLFPVVTSFGGVWAGGPFALEVCARAIRSAELLALFAPDPCIALEKAARAADSLAEDAAHTATEKAALAADSAIGSTAVTVLGSILRTSAALPLTATMAAALILKSAETLVGYLVNLADTRRKFLFAFVCMSLTDRIRNREVRHTPASLVSTVVIKRQDGSEKTDFGTFARLAGVEYETRLESRFDSAFACRGHAAPRLTVANLLQSMMAIRRRQAAEEVAVTHDHGVPDSEVAQQAAYAAELTAEADDAEEPPLTAAAPIDGDDERAETSPLAMSAAELVAILNGVAGETEVNAGELFRQFIAQGAAAIEENEDGGAPPADDADDDDDDAPPFAVPLPDGDNGHSSNDSGSSLVRPLDGDSDDDPPDPDFAGDVKPVSSG